MSDGIGVWEQLVDAHNEVLAAFGFNSTSDLVDRVSASMTGPTGSGGVLDGVTQFVNAVEWKDPFFVYLGTFHIVLWFLAFAVCWRSSTRTMVLMSELLGLVALSSILNGLGQQHYAWLFAPSVVEGVSDNSIDPVVKKMIEDNAGSRKISFAPTSGGPINYFDKNGVFISAVYSAPMLLLAFILQVRLIFLMVVMMVKVKKLQLRTSSPSSPSARQDGPSAQEKKAKKKQ